MYLHPSAQNPSYADFCSREPHFIQRPQQACCEVNVHVLGLPARMREGSKLFALNLYKGGLAMRPDMNRQWTKFLE